MKGRSPTPISYGPEGRSRPGSSLGMANGHSHGRGHSHLSGRLQQLQAENAPPGAPPGARNSPVGGRCDACLRCLQDLRRQAFQLVLPSPKNMDFLLKEQPNLAASVQEKLKDTDHEFRRPDGHCERCETSMVVLKQEAVTMVQNMDFATNQSHGNGHGHGHGHGQQMHPALVNKMGRHVPRTSPHHRQLARLGLAKTGYYHQVQTASTKTWASTQRFNGMFPPGQAKMEPGAVAAVGGGAPAGAGAGAYQSSSAAASFFARAGQKMHSSGVASSSSSSSKKKRRTAAAADAELKMHFKTNFQEVLRLAAPVAPAALLKPAGRKEPPGMGKVKVMLRVVHSDTGKGTDSSTCVSVDQRRKQVTLFDPGSQGGFAAPSQRRAGHSAPKMFAFDAVFNEEDALNDICSTAMTDIVQAVVNGADGCLFCFGHGRLGKSHTMIGGDTSVASLGAIPCAISWLFKLINEQKERSGARFSVRVSAVEVAGKDEQLKDLLADIASATEAAGHTAPGVYLREDPISGTQLENQSELRAPSADKAAYYLDAALNQRTVPENDDERRNSHLLFTLHVYQYRVEKSGSGTGVAGGRSRLHLIDLGSGSSRSSSSGALSLAALGSVVMALVNGQRHIPHRESKLSQLLREALGSLACRACMIAHVSSNVQHYQDSLQVVQAANKIQRLRRRKARGSGASSDDSSSCDSFGVRRAGRLRPQMGTLREGVLKTSALTSSENDYSSSSEQSCDTAIYIGSGAGEMTDGEGPPGRDSVLMRKLAAASSGDESDEHRTSGSGTPRMSPMQRRRKLSGHKNAPRTNAKAWPKVNIRDAIETLSTQKEQWVDGPRACYSPPPQGAPDAHTPTGCPIDGPRSGAATPTAPDAPEKWIDGPNASPPTTEERRKSMELIQPVMVPSIHSKETLINTPGEPPKSGMIDACTQSEEPYESESSTSTYSTLDKKTNRVLSDISERTEDTSTTGGEGNDSGNKDSAPDEEMEEAAANEALEQIEIPSQATEEFPVVPPSSRPAPLSVAPAKPRAPLETSTKDSHSTNTESGGGYADPQVARVKPFVRDWVEKHSVISSAESSLCAEVDKHSEKQHYASTPNSPVHTLHKPHAGDGLDRSSHQSYQSSPVHSAGARRHESNKKRARKTSLPQNHQPQNHVTNFARVAQWVESVNTDCSRAQSLSPTPAMQQQHQQQQPIPGGKFFAAGSLDRKCVQSPQMTPRHCKTAGAPGTGTGSQVATSVLSETEQEMERVWFASAQHTHQFHHRPNSRTPAQPLNCSSPFSQPDTAISVSSSANCSYYSTPQLQQPPTPTQPIEAPSTPTHLVRPTCVRQGAPTSAPPPLPPQRVSTGTQSSAPATIGAPRNLLIPVQPCQTPPVASSEKTSSSRSSTSIIKNAFFQKSNKESKDPKKCSSPRKTSIPSLSSVHSATSGSKASVSSVTSSPKTPSKKEKKEEKKRSASASPVSSGHSVSSCKEANGSKSLLPLPTKSKDKRDRERSKEVKQRDRDGRRKEKEERSSSGGRLSFLTSPLFGKKKDKEGGSSSSSKRSSKEHRDHHHRSGGSRLMELSGRGSRRGRGTTFEEMQCRMLSPYHTITQPRASAHSSSGHGSDCSSLFGIKSRDGCQMRHGGTSSGYESMLRDSEASSSHNDSTSESSVSGVVKAPKFIKRKSNSSSGSSRSRSRSAPPRSGETENSEGTQSPASVRRISPRAWHRGASGEPLEGEELQRCRREEAEEIGRQIRFEKIHELLARQDELKQELIESKERLMVDRSTWSFDLHVAEQMDPDENSFLEALEKETAILAKRVEACKSHIMMVSCFDMRQTVV